MIGIVAVVRQPLVRLGLHHLCNDGSTMKLVAEASTVREGLQLIDELKPDVVIVDLPRTAGRATDAGTVGHLVSRSAAVLALINPIPASELLGLLRTGVAGAVDRNAEPTDLRHAIVAVARGDVYCEVNRNLNGDRLQNQGCRLGPRLTAKEAEVLSLVTSGRTNREIAELIYVSETTAKFHVGNLLRKFGATRRSELAYLAAQRGLF